MRDIYISRRFGRPIAVGLLLCGLFGFALGQAIGRHPAVPPVATTAAARAAGALGTPAPTPSTRANPTTTTPPTISQAPAAVFVPAVYSSPAPPRHHHKDKHGDDGDKGPAKQHDENKGHGGHDGKHGGNGGD